MKLLVLITINKRPLLGTSQLSISRNFLFLTTSLSNWRSGFHILAKIPLREGWRKLLLFSIPSRQPILQLLTFNWLTFCWECPKFIILWGSLAFCLKFPQLLFRFFRDVLILYQSGLHIAIGGCKGMPLV